jgi:hypothetical protein
VSVVDTLPHVRGRLTAGAPLAPLVWFKSGGRAEWLFEPKDIDDLGDFLSDLDPSVPVMGLGLGSNLIVRDGGVPGIVVRLGKAFARVEGIDATTLRCGGGASGILVSSSARDAGIGGLEFLRSIPGTVGGFVRMNGGAYGREVRDIGQASSSAHGRTPAGRLGYTMTPIAGRRSSSARLPWPAGAGPSRRKWTGSPASARPRSRSAAAPAARRSRIPRAPRPGS